MICTYDLKLMLPRGGRTIGTVEDRFPALNLYLIDPAQHIITAGCIGYI